jgi:branched-chain amino acid transport system substrate-binding protein
MCGAAIAAGCGGQGSQTGLQASAPAPDQAAKAAAVQAPAAGQPVAGAPAAAPAAGQPQAGAAAGKSLSGAPAGNARPGVPSAPPVAAPGNPAPGGNSASDVGVTKDQINIGIINMASANRSLGPPIALASQRVTDGLVHYINDNGGIAGRKLNLVTCDDGGDVTRARACYEKLKSQVFAFVPSESFITDTIHDTLAKDKVPWMSWGWFKSEYTDPYMFPCHANGMKEARNLAKWVAETLHPQTVGIMYLNVTEDIAAKDEAARTLQQYGVKVVQTVGQEWDSPDESQHVLAMRVANPDHIMSFSWPAPVAKFFHDAGGQNWAPKLGFSGNHLTADPGYGPIFSDYIKGKLTTITSWVAPGAQNEPAGTSDLSGLKLMRAVANRYAGDNLVGFKFRYAMGHHITQSAFACTKIFADTARQLGPNLTRAGLISALESGSYDTGMGVTLRWPHGAHGQDPYPFSREYMYQWVGTADGGYDLKRVQPDANL